jgi:hypothetical protein
VEVLEKPFKEVDILVEVGPYNDFLSFFDEFSTALRYKYRFGGNDMTVTIATKRKGEIALTVVKGDGFGVLCHLRIWLIVAKGGNILTLQGIGQEERIAHGLK